MNIGVTGGSGFIGSELCLKLLEKGHNVFIYDISEPVEILLHKNLTFYNINLLDKVAVNEAFKNVDAVYHLAGVVLGGMKKDPQLGIELNVMGTMNVLESCKLNNVDKIMVASTFYIYDCIKELDIVDENTVLNIMESSFFGASKIMDELMTRRFCEQNHIKYNILRFGSVYGAGRASNSVKKFISNTINGVKTEIWGKGNRKNQFTNVKDIADGCILPLEKNIFWLYLVILGVAGFVSHSLIIYAIQLSNLSFVTNFQYSQLVWSTIINFLIFGVPFDYNKIVGVIGIIVFGIMFIRTEGKKKS